MFYVNGLYIECGGEFNYGYDFKPRYISLERDRKSCDSWNARQVTCKMIASAILSGSLDFETTKVLIEKDTDDINLMEFTSHDGIEKIAEKLSESFDEKYNSSKVYVPVNSDVDSQRVKAYGGIPVIVPYRVSSMLSDFREERIKYLRDTSPSDDTLTVKERFQKWYTLYSHRLNYEAKGELEKLINML